MLPSFNLAMPKSKTLTRSPPAYQDRPRSLMLAGFRSRWTIRLAWAATRAEVIWRAMRMASWPSDPCLLMRSRSVSPSRYSMTM